MKKISFFALLSIVVLFFACQPADKQEVKTPSEEGFNKTIDGKPVKLFTLKNANGIEVKVINYGARIVSVVTPDKTGKFADIALGYNTIDEYEKDNMYLGCAVGRYANRIKQGKFKIDSTEYQLPVNDGLNTLHGGKKGFDKVIWDVVQDSTSLNLSYTAADMEEGFPGNLSVKMKYTLTDQNELKIEYAAETDKATIINLTNHSYFNLKGEGDSTILDHELMINAANITPVDSTLIPSGEMMSVNGTPFDFQSPAVIGARINNDHIQLKYGKGYDHNWVLNNTTGQLSLAAVLSEPTTGRAIEISTTEPGIQFYSGNFMNGSANGKLGKPYVYRAGVALETQHFPDSPNQPNFPSTLLKPGEKYSHVIVYKFTVK